MVIAKLRSFFSLTSKREAQEVYIALVAQSRKPFFYTACAVPDTLDGRFEIILLHVFLALRHIGENVSAGSAQARQRLLLECLFDDMDRSLREMGVGDMGVGKRVKTMSRAAYGRLEAYTQAFADDAALGEALTRNIYRGAEVKPEALALLLGYVRGYQAAP